MKNLFEEGEKQKAKEREIKEQREKMKKYWNMGKDWGKKSAEKKKKKME